MKRMALADSSEGNASKRSRLDAPSDVRSMSSKAYLDELVVPTLLRALSAVNKERPADPIDFLIAYLSKEKEKGGEEEGIKSEKVEETKAEQPAQ